MTSGGRDSPDETLEIYRRLWAADIEEVHELIAEHGTKILAKGRPYVLTAARRRAVSRWRRESRRSELERTAESGRQPTLQQQDPAIVTERRELLDILRDALNDLPNTSLLVTWRRAEGQTYEQIADEWVQLGFGKRPSVAALRQIHRRSILALRRRLGTGPHTSDGDPDAQRPPPGNT